MLFPLIVARNEALPLVRIGGTSLKPESLARICAPSCVPLLWPRLEASASDVAASANTTSAPIAQVRRIGTPPFAGGSFRVWTEGLRPQSLSALRLPARPNRQRNREPRPRCCQRDVLFSSS